MNSLPSKRDTSDVDIRASSDVEEKSNTGKREKAVRIPLLSEFCTMKKLLRLVLGPTVNEEDIYRWFSQGFTFAKVPSFGLKQGAGGPCGVLAAVQGCMLHHLIFSARIVSTEDDLMHLPSSAVRASLTSALWHILQRCGSGDRVNMIEWPSVGEFSLSSCGDLRVHEASSEDSFAEILCDLWPSYSSGCGCFFFLLSMIITRGAETVMGDMDDSESSLIGLFGHCTQELMNLLLTGRASSNVFDGEIPMDDSASDDHLMLRGIAKAPPVGYLSQLECLRYCEVGSLYKVPTYPIWVIGSATHFTVLFSMDRRVNEESSEEQLLARVQRVFKAVDSDGCGFVMDTQLAGILEQLEVPFASDPTDVLRFSSLVQLEGGIVLWSTFWEKVSLLLTGTSLDELVEGPIVNTRVRSDSDIARELQAGFDDAAADSAEPTARDTLPRSDSDLARQLQEEWNSPHFEPTAMTPSTSDGSAVANSDNPARTPRRRHRSDSIAGKDDESFILFHYNGFGGAENSQKLCKFVMYRRSADESVGQSVALSTAGVHAFGAVDICPIEDVLRTRWPGCRSDFLGQPPPSLD